MIKYVQADLIANASEEKAIIHGCNCFCRMKSGFAKQVVRAFPEAQEVDNQTVAGDMSKLGTYTRTNNTDPIIFNLYTQYRYGRGKDLFQYDHAETGLFKLFQDHPEIKRFSMPMIGAGLAGGDWVKIERIIEFCSNKNGKLVIIYKL